MQRWQAVKSRFKRFRYSHFLPNQKFALACCSCDRTTICTKNFNIWDSHIITIISNYLCDSCFVHRFEYQQVITIKQLSLESGKRGIACFFAHQNLSAYCTRYYLTPSCLNFRYNFCSFCWVSLSAHHP